LAVAPVATGSGLTEERMSALLQSFADSGLAPHGFCLMWEPGLIWLHVVADAAIGLSYYLIPPALAFFVWQRQDLEFGWIFWMFAAFILACGTTHFFEIWVLWHPDYAVQGLIKAATATVSLVTGIMLWPLVPRALALPSPAQLRRVNAELSMQINERNAAFDTLRQSEERYRQLYQRTPVPIHSADQNMRLINVNESWLNLLGYRRDAVIGRRIIDFMTEDTAAHHVEAVWPTLAAGGEVKDHEYRFRAATGAVVDVLCSSRVEPGELPGSFLTFDVLVDVTARKEAESALESARAMVAQSQKMEAVGQLTGGVAHDFNNLLTTIMGNVDLAQRRLAGTEVAPLLASVRRAAERGAALTQRLLAFSRRQPLAPREIDLNRLVAGMSELLRRTLGETIAVETVSAGGLWHVLVDPNQLESALLNLAVNARDAMPEGGTLRIATANVVIGAAEAARYDELEPGDYVSIAVGDSGVGMSEEVLRRAFEPFFTTKPEGKGTGLGLSQIYGFARQSGGDTTIASTPGAGTTVTILLPREAASAVEPGAEDAESEAPRGTETVLVVEDEPAVRDYSVAALGDLGYRVLFAEDATGALRLLDTSRDISVLFTDIGLPGINGRQLAELALRRVPGLKILFTTGYARDAAVRRNPGGELLLKPFSVAGLARKLRQLIDAV
jgi:PAS domain S-box-containing protein